MSSAVGSVLAGAVFGIALAAPPGPMNAIIAEESVARGWFAGVRAGLGAMTADAAFLVLAAAGVVAFVERMPTLRAAMVGVGGLLMLYFAYGAATEFGTAFRPDGAGGAAAGNAAERGGRSTGFRKAFALALTNPYQILFWLTIGVGLLEPGTVDVLAHVPYASTGLTGLLVVETGSPALLVGFFGGIGAWVTGFPATLVVAERRVESFAPAVTALSALVLAGFGVGFLSDAVTSLL